MSVPKIIFVIPYRDRNNHLNFFKRQMKYILEDVPKEDYEMFFVHQLDKNPFNRGAMKNIGFLAMKEKYPKDYKTITFVFNDIDTMPFNKGELDYKTTKGNIKHFYGFRFSLGGIVSVTGEDYEKMNGFPNFWSWGYEDNDFQRRATDNKITIDRSTFFYILDKNFIHLHHGLVREVNPEDKKRFNMKSNEGIKDIKKLKYVINENMINVNTFETGNSPNKEKLLLYQLDKESPLKRTDNRFNSNRMAKAKMRMFL